MAFEVLQKGETAQGTICDGKTKVAVPNPTALPQIHDKASAHTCKEKSQL